MKCLIHCKSRNKVNVKPCANGCNIVGCYMLRLFAHPVACCWMLLRVVAQSLYPVKLFSQQLPTFLLFRDHRLKRSATMLDPFAQFFQHCWGHERALCMVYKDFGLYPSHDALQVPTLLRVVASVCTPLPTRTQQLPTLLAQRCWELFRLFARSLNAQCNLLYFSKTHKVQCSKANWCLRFSLLSIILADLLGNRTLL